MVNSVFHKNNHYRCQRAMDPLYHRIYTSLWGTIFRYACFWFQQFSRHSLYILQILGNSSHYSLCNVTLTLGQSYSLVVTTLCSREVHSGLFMVVSWDFKLSSRRGKSSKCQYNSDSIFIIFITLLQRSGNKRQTKEQREKSRTIISRRHSLP